jgi:hypothetical protein
MAHIRKPNSTISGNARVAVAFRRVSQAIRPAILLFPSPLSLGEAGSRTQRPAREEHQR